MSKNIKAFINKIEFIVPKNKLSNSSLVKENPSWDIDKIYNKTGIENRFIAGKDTTAVDLAIEAGNLFFKKNPKDKKKIDYLIFCTQSPDYFLPTSACIIQNKLGLGTNIGAIDVNQGCSGFVYSLSLAKGMIESNQVNNILIITSETYSKYINDGDKSVRTLFGDAASCILISSKFDDDLKISPVLHGTDGSGAKHLIVPDGGHRSPINDSSNILKYDENKNVRSSSNLYMDGSSIFLFTLSKIPKVFNQILINNKLSMDDLDIVILHQANKMILDTLQKKLKIPERKMHRSYQKYGNTVSSTIPIGLKIEMDKKVESKEKIALLLGFGVGLSWAGTIIKF
jgi:3-oxoacyl-[acyl-carrier-protein] synthase-3